MLGWEPREITTHEYDVAGHLTRSVVVREPEYDGEQLALLVALDRLESQPRGSHGLLLSEATDLKNQWGYVASYRTDWAQKALDDAAEALRKQYPDANENGRMWTVKPRS